jgi:hypothetical protein
MSPWNTPQIKQVIAHRTGYYRRVHMYVYVITAYTCDIKYRQLLTLAFKIHVRGHVNEDLKCYFFEAYTCVSCTLPLPYLGNVALTPSVRFCQFGKLKVTRSGWPWSAYQWCQILSDSVKRFPVSNMPTDSICYFLSLVSGCAIERSERERGRNHCVFFAEMKTEN